MSLEPRPSPPPAAAAAGPRLAGLHPGWFTASMGVSGLALAWGRATALWPGLQPAAAALAVLAGGVFGALLLASLGRRLRLPGCWAADRADPLRHPLLAAVPVAMLLAATLATAWFGPTTAARLLWALGALGLLLSTAWVLGRAWRGRHGPAPWTAITPLMLVPVVGHVIAPLAGPALGLGPWAAAQGLLGALLWPGMLLALWARRRAAGDWPPPLAPSAFILVAPPALLGQGAAEHGLPGLAALLAGLALAQAAWALRQAGPRLRALPFALPFWALGFPHAALAGLGLRLAETWPALQPLAGLLLAGVTLLILALGGRSLLALRPPRR